MKISRRGFLSLGACVAALAIAGCTGTNNKASSPSPMSTPSVKWSIPETTSPSVQPSTSSELVILLPEAAVVDTVENQAGTDVLGLSCNKDSSVPLTLQPDKEYRLDGSTVVMSVNEAGAIITSDNGIPAKSLIVNERLAAPLTAELRQGTAHVLLLPNVAITDGGWGDVAYPANTFKEVILCRSLGTS